MPELSKGLMVPRRCGEAVRKVLVDMGLYDRSRKIYSDDEHVYLPIVEDVALEGALHEALEGISSAADITDDIAVVEGEFLQEPPIITPESILGYQPGYEVVGDIAILNPETKEPERVGEALMKVHRGLKSVVIPVSDVEGEYRTRRFKGVAGTGSTATVHRENGLRYAVDLERAYFTPRLATERLRIADLVRPGESVLDMFAGVGPFALLLAKRGAKVVAVDKNPVAVRWLRENARLNKVEGVEIIEGDAREVAGGLACTADRIIMNLPHTAHDFLDAAMAAAGDGGVVHYYAISSEDDLFKDEGLILDAAARSGSNVDILYRGVVRSYAPRRYNVVIDFRVKKACKEEKVSKRGPEAMRRSWGVDGTEIRS